jgi:hypothetical protein
MARRKKDEPDAYAVEKFFCTICGAAIDLDRVKRKATTCSDEHRNILNNARRRLRDSGRCHGCNRPSTPEERESWNAWRKSLPETRGNPNWKKKAAENPTPLEKHLGTTVIQ